MWYKFADSGDKSEFIPSQPPSDLAEELLKVIIGKFEKHKVCSSLKDKFWGVALANIQLISEFNKGFGFSLSVIDIYITYACVLPVWPFVGNSNHTFSIFSVTSNAMILTFYVFHFLSMSYIFPKCYDKGCNKL